MVLSESFDPGRCPYSPPGFGSRRHSFDQSHVATYQINVGNAKFKISGFGNIDFTQLYYCFELLFLEMRALHFRFLYWSGSARLSFFILEFYSKITG